MSKVPKFSRTPSKRGLQNEAFDDRAKSPTVYLVDTTYDFHGQPDYLNKCATPECIFYDQGRSHTHQLLLWKSRSIGDGHSTIVELLVHAGADIYLPHSLWNIPVWPIPGHKCLPVPRAVCVKVATGLEEVVAERRTEPSFILYRGSILSV